MYLNEKLYYIYITLKTGFIDIKDYEKWLDDYYAKDSKNEVIGELEWAFSDISKIINILDIYLYDKISDINYNIIWEMIISDAQKWYKDNKNLETLTKILYELWCILPKEISNEMPFIKLNSLDDAWVCNREEAPDKIRAFLQEQAN